MKGTGIRERHIKGKEVYSVFGAVKKGGSKAEHWRVVNVVDWKARDCVLWANAHADSCHSSTSNHFLPTFHNPNNCTCRSIMSTPAPSHSSFDGETSYPLPPDSIRDVKVSLAISRVDSVGKPLGKDTFLGHGPTEDQAYRDTRQCQTLAREHAARFRPLSSIAQELHDNLGYAELQGAAETLCKTMISYPGQEAAAEQIYDIITGETKASDYPDSVASPWTAAVHSEGVLTTYTEHVPLDDEISAPDTDRGWPDYSACFTI
jgi:hypothetical protein